MKKRFTAIFLALALCAGLAVPVSADTAPTFTDVKPGDTYYDAIMAMVNAGAINGYGDGTFGPNDPITHNQFSNVMNRVRGVTEAQITFGADAIENKTVDRGAAALWMYYYLQSGRTPDNIKRILSNTSLTNAKARFAGDTYAYVNTVDDFADGETIHTWVSDYCDAYRAAGTGAPGSEKALRNLIRMAYNYDLTKWLVGADMKFDPYATITRGELCQCLYNAGIVGLAPVGTAPYSVPVTGVTPETPATVAGFTDVPAGVWYTDAVEWAVSKKITNGTGATKFSPDDNCTHDQILTFLYRADRGQGKADPADMDKAVAWAREKGMIDGGFNGGKECTRADAVSYIWQALGKEDAPASSFIDVPANASYARAVDWAVANGVTNGTNDAKTQFSPTEVCTRGQIVTFLHRAFVPEARQK